MIEIKNIVKTYRPKKGGEVKALDDVSLKFPEKGLVFILGKSGSGKSTLLNVMGGLDTADSGEIIIKGKSSKEFSTGDFDSYRNTYLGFIFQEYNILEDFNVGANIALALKLQGAKATDEKINEILDEVGLSGYGKRKPNELSGGQKQRVAIARALVKNPEIIMADEPTGALDSGTGIQVFDTLKKLSKDKLVIVVSHDREFAESYGDRVIELKDGKVISDIEKHRIDAEVEEGGAENYKGKLLRFPKGYRLTADDVKRINEYLERDEAYLSLDEKVNADVKTASHIDEDGKMESFAPTDENAIKISDDKPFRLIKSRMPVKESFKMGVGVVKTGYDYSRYAALDKTVGSDDDALDYFMLQSQFSSEHNSAFSGLLFCGKDFIKNYLAYDSVGGEIYDRAILQSEEINGKTRRMYMGGDYRHYFTTTDYAGTVFFDSGKTTLSDDEIVLEVKQLINALKNVYYDDTGICDRLDGIENSSDKEEIKATLSPLVKDAKIKMQCGGTYNPYITKILTIKGFFFEDENVDKSFIGVSDTFAAEIKNAPVGKYARAISGEKLSKSDLEKVVEFSMKNEDGVKYPLVNYVVSAENMVGSIIEAAAKILLYVGIGVFVFAVILFMTYISASISYKKREIGILRAVGARSSDVFGIFFNEALVISLIVFVLATIGSGVVVSIVNSSLRATYGLPITLLSYGIREVGIILLGCIATALFASFIPVLRIARKKPVDAIKNR